MLAGGNYTVTFRLPDSSSSSSESHLFLLPQSLRLLPHGDEEAYPSWQQQQRYGDQVQHQDQPQPQQVQQQHLIQQQNLEQQTITAARPGTTSAAADAADTATEGQMGRAPPFMAPAAAPPAPAAAHDYSQAAEVNRAPPYLVSPAAPQPPAPQASTAEQSSATADSNFRAPPFVPPNVSPQPPAPAATAPAADPPETEVPAPPPAPVVPGPVLEHADSAAAVEDTGRQLLAADGLRTAETASKSEVEHSQNAAAGRHLQYSAGGDSSSSSSRPDPRLLAQLAGFGDDSMEQHSAADTDSSSSRSHREIPFERMRVPSFTDFFSSRSSHHESPASSSSSGLRTAAAPAGRYVWGIPPPPPAFVVPADKAVVPARPGHKSSAVKVSSNFDYPVPVITLPNEGVVSLVTAGTCRGEQGSADACEACCTASLLVLRPCHPSSGWNPCQGCSLIL